MTSVHTSPPATDIEQLVDTAFKALATLQYSFDDLKVSHGWLRQSNSVMRIGLVLGTSLPSIHFDLYAIGDNPALGLVGIGGHQCNGEYIPLEFVGDNSDAPRLAVSLTSESHRAVKRLIDEALAAQAHLR